MSSDYVVKRAVQSGWWLWASQCVDKHPWPDIDISGGVSRGRYSHRSARQVHTSTPKLLLPSKLLHKYVNHEFSCPYNWLICGRVGHFFISAWKFGYLAMITPYRLHEHSVSFPYLVLNWTPCHKDICGSGTIAPCILNHNCRWKWVTTPHPGRFTALGRASLTYWTKSSVGVFNHQLKVVSFETDADFTATCTTEEAKTGNWGRLLDMFTNHKRKLKRNFNRVRLLECWRISKLKPALHSCFICKLITSWGAQLCPCSFSNSISFSLGL
jgi:hypothetical protein